MTIPANGRACAVLEIVYGDATEAEAQVAQSDQVTWSFTFVGTAS